MEKNKPSTEPQSEKSFNPNRAQRRAGVKTYTKVSEKKARQLATNHPPKVIDRRRFMVACRKTTRTDFALTS